MSALAETRDPGRARAPDKPAVDDARAARDSRPLIESSERPAAVPDGAREGARAREPVLSHSRIRARAAQAVRISDIRRRRNARARRPGRLDNSDKAPIFAAFNVNAPALRGSDPPRWRVSFVSGRSLGARRVNAGKPEPRGCHDLEVGALDCAGCRRRAGDRQPGAVAEENHGLTPPRTEP